MRYLGVLIVALLSLAGCGGGGVSLGSGGGSEIDLGPSKYSAAQRTVAMDAVGVKYEELLTANPATALEKLAEFTRQRPEFASAEVNEGTVVAQFKDGRVFVFLDNFKGDAVPRPEGRLITPTASVPIPGRPTALVFQQDIDDTQGHKPFLGQISQILGKGGYNVVTSQSFDIETVKAAGVNLGVFYVHSHGAEFWWNDKFETREYALMSDTLVNANNDARYEDDIRAGRLIYNRVRSVRDADSVYKGRYAITSRFISKYVTMAPRGVAYINACNSASQMSQLLRQTFMAKGAGLYIGYSAKTTDFGYEPAAFFFDRTMGANIHEPPTPLGRVFTVSDVWQKMGEKKHRLSPNFTYLQDPVIGSSLLKFETDTKMLTPNIRSLRFFLNDNMGIVTDAPVASDDLKVMIAGQHVPHQVQNGLIMVHLEPSMAGDVWLEANDRKSNKRPIVSWRGVVDYEQPIAPGTGASAKLSVRFNLHLRADGLEVRSAVDGPLFDEGTPFYAASDSTATYTFSGSAGNASFSGAKTLAYGFPANATHPFSCTGYVLATEKRMRIYPTVFEPVATVTGPGGSFNQVYSPVPGAWEFWDQPAQPGREIISQGWVMDLDTDLSIKAKTYNGRIGGVTVSTIRWAQMTPSPAVADSAGR